MLGKRTLRRMLDQVLPELPSLTPAQLEHLEDPLTPEARALVGLAVVVDELDLGQLDELEDVLVQQLHLQALWCEETMTAEPHPDAWERRDDIAEVLIDTWLTIGRDVDEMADRLSWDE